MLTISASGRGGPARRRVVIVCTLLAGLLLAPFVAGALATPAYAGTQFCAGKGVNVAVDFGELGGGVKTLCDDDGVGKTATQVFEESGFALTPVGSFPGAICKVDDQPADTACAEMPPAEAYWGLYVEKKGSWDYAPKGADELKLADGDFVGLAWQSSKDSSPPAVEPVASSRAPATAEASGQTAAQDEDSSDSWWILALVVLALLVAAGGVAASRRRASAD